MMEPQSPNPLNVPMSLYLKLRPLPADQFTVSKCCLCCSFPIGYNFWMVHTCQIHWAVPWSKSVQNLLWGSLCRCGVQRRVCLWPLPTCPHHKTFNMQIQDLKHLPGERQWVPVSPGCPPQRDGDCHHHGAECHWGPPCPWGQIQLAGMTSRFWSENHSVCLHLQCPLIAYK